MVKPEYKTTDKAQVVAMKEPLDKELPEDDESVSFDGIRHRHRPPVCTFMVLLILVLLAGFLAVYFVDKWKSNRSKHDAPMDHQMPIPTLSDSNVSWETQEELFHLSDIIDQNHLLGLRPIYRKDLPAKYIAYWEVKLSMGAKEKYFIVSAAKQTGDHRLAEEGTLPSPSDFLTEQAQRNGHHCHKVFRLTPDGLMVCEDMKLRRLVASTRNIDGNSGRVEWHKLDLQVSRALPQFARDWGELARRVQKTPEWNRFKWLSMDEDASASPAASEPTEPPVEFRTEVEAPSPSSGLDAEFGLRPGDMVRIPLGSGFADVRIEFAGFKSRALDRNRAWRNRWQKRLCRVLSDVCDGARQSVRRNSKFFKRTSAGDRYIKIKVHPDEHFVRKQLQGHEVRFQVKLYGRQSRAAIAINYGIMLKSHQLRRGRSVKHEQYFDVPHEEFFPDYTQHHNGQCMTGSGPVAWAMVLGYYDNLVRRAPELKLKFSATGRDTPLPLNMTKEVESLVNSIHSTLETHCTPQGVGVTRPANMKRLQKWLGQRLHRDLPLVTYREHAGREADRAPALLAKLLQQGVPVVVSKQRGDTVHHYVVATRLRQRSRMFRACDTKRGRCSDWTASTVSEMFVRQGLGGHGNRWENADTGFVSALLLH